VNALSQSEMAVIMVILMPQPPYRGSKERFEGLHQDKINVEYNALELAITITKVINITKCIL